CLKCNALLTLAASALGTNLPSRTTPLACAARCVVCLPNAELSASTNDSGVVAIAGSFRVLIAVLRWNDPFPRVSGAEIRCGCLLWGENERGAAQNSPSGPSWRPLPGPRREFSSSVHAVGAAWSTSASLRKRLKCRGAVIDVMCQ